MFETTYHFTAVQPSSSTNEDIKYLIDEGLNVFALMRINLPSVRFIKTMSNNDKPIAVSESHGPALYGMIHKYIENSNLKVLYLDIDTYPVACEKMKIRLNGYDNVIHTAFALKIKEEGGDDPCSDAQDLIVDEDSKCYNIFQPKWKSITVNTGLCNTITSSFSIAGHECLETISIHRSSFMNLNTLMITNNNALTSIEIQGGNNEGNGACINVNDVHLLRIYN